MQADLATLLARAVRHHQPIPFVSVSNLACAVAVAEACSKVDRPYYLVAETAIWKGVPAVRELPFIEPSQFEAFLKMAPAVLLKGSHTPTQIKEAATGGAVILGSTSHTRSALKTAVRSGAAGIWLEHDVSQAYTAGLRAALRDRELFDPAVYERKASLAVREALHHFLLDTTNL